MKTILVGIDFSEPYAELVERAASFARVLDARVRLIHVAPPDPGFISSSSWPQVVRDGFASELKEEHSNLVRIAEQLTGRGLRADAQMARGPVVDVLLEQIERTKPELIILGSTPGGGLFQALGGGVVRGILKSGSCAVLVVPLTADHDEDVDVEPQAEPEAGRE